jgi:hypothetical protein
VWASGCRIVAKRLTPTGGAYRVSVRLPDSGQGGYVATPGPPAKKSVNSTRANVGPRGREWRAPVTIAASG